MKKFVLVLAVLMLLGISQAEASDFSCDGPFGSLLNKCIRQPQMIVRAGVGAPNLVKLPWDWFFGIEAMKDIVTDPFDGDYRTWIEDDQGYYIGFKFEWRGTLLDLSGKK